MDVEKKTKQVTVPAMREVPRKTRTEQITPQKNLNIIKAPDKEKVDWQWALHKTESVPKVNAEILEKPVQQKIKTQIIPEEEKVSGMLIPEKPVQDRQVQEKKVEETMESPVQEEKTAKELKNLEKEWFKEENEEKVRKQEAEKEYIELESLMLGEDEENAGKKKNTKKT